VKSPIAVVVVVVVVVVMIKICSDQTNNTTHDQGMVTRLSAGPRNISRLHRVHTGSGSHVAPYKKTVPQPWG
jgi:hypothetical protein